MGYSDRDYMRPDYQGPGRGFKRPAFFEGAPVTKWLIIINVAVLFLQALMTPKGAQPFLQAWGHFSIEEAIYRGQIWRFVTFQFLHGFLGHLLLNGIGILIFGPHIERWMTSRAFLVFYLLCGVAGALFYSILYFIPGILDGYSPSSRMVGASAGVFGILAAFYYAAPKATVLLFFVIPMQMKTLALAYFAYETIAVLFNFHNAGGSAGHLGGAIFGLLMLKWPPLRNLVVKISQIGESDPRKKKSRDATIIREERKSPLELTKEVDRILDKISEHGIQSLTKTERETLDKARKK